MSNTEYTAPDFVRMTLEEFPELEDEFREYEGLVHLQVGCLARVAQTAKKNADWRTFRRAIALIDELWKKPTPELENALNVSFLEHIDFDGPHGPTAWNTLTPALQKAWKEMQQYLVDLDVWARKQKRKK